jgi:hypothetical protein
MVAPYTDGSGPQHLNTNNNADANQRLAHLITTHNKFKLKIHRVMRHRDRGPWILQQCRSPTGLNRDNRTERVGLIDPLTVEHRPGVKESSRG